jgi:enamine deaminase RidA (YjgF/YER057c/UK114 family)
MQSPSISLIKTIKAETGPKAIGPYSSGKIVNGAANMVYLSGQLGIDEVPHI